MTELSDEKKKVLERLRRANEKRDRVSPSKRAPITNPDKFSFPVGLDDEGKPFGESPENAQGPNSSKTKPASSEEETATGGIKSKPADAPKK